MKAKKYNCEIEGCEWGGTMRSTVKNRDSEHYGSKVCPFHAKEFNEYKENTSELKRTPIKTGNFKLKSNKPIKKLTQKGIDKRKADRKGYAEFFQKHIAIIQNENRVCENCSGRLRGAADEVGHILGKQTFKSVATEDLNIVYLCSPFSSYDTNDCHSRFDRDLSTREKMPVFKIAQERYKLFKDKVLEVGKEQLQLEGENF